MKAKTKKAIRRENPTLTEPSVSAGDAIPDEKTMCQERRLADLIAHVKLYDFLQEQRIRLGNRGKIKKDGKSQKILHGELKAETERAANEPVRAYMEKQEKETLAIIEDLVSDFPLWTKFLSKVKGIGPSIAGHIMASFDIHKAPTVSNFWAFAGLSPHMVNGKKFNAAKKTYVSTNTEIRADKLTAGFVSPFNKHLRTVLCGILATSLMMQESEPYYGVYLARRKYLEENDWGMPSKKPGDKDKPKAYHQDRAARRYMIKRFVRDLWVAWREIEGLTVSEPWSAANQKQPIAQERVA